MANLSSSNMLSTPTVLLLPAKLLTLPDSEEVPVKITHNGGLELVNLTYNDLISSGNSLVQNLLTEMKKVSEMEYGKSAEIQTDSECHKLMADKAIDTSVDPNHCEPIDFTVTKDASLLKVSQLINSEKQTNSLNTASNDIIVDSINLSEIVRFAKTLKEERQSKHLTQAQISKSIAQLPGSPFISQSFLSRFEKLDVNLQSASRLVLLLKDWFSKILSIAEQPCLSALTPGVDSEPACLSAEKDDLVKISIQEDALSEAALRVHLDAVDARRRKKRTYFTKEVLEKLEEYFTVNNKPRGHDLTSIANQLDLNRASVHGWFCNRRKTKRASKSKT